MGTPKGKGGNAGEAALAKKAVAAAAKRAKAKSSGGGSDFAGKKRPRDDSQSNKAPAKPMTSKERKEASRAKKMKIKPNFGLIQEITGIWEKMRPTEVPEATKKSGVESIMTKVAGRIAELAMSHTASRVIQACAKHGGDDVRKAILTEIKAKLLDVSKSSYGNFVVRKLISCAPKTEIPVLLKAFKGRIPELMRHPCGSAVIVDLYAEATSQQRDVMVAEFYGREFQLFDAKGSDEVHRLGDRMAKMTPTQRKGTLRHLTIQLSPIMEKGLVDSELVHRLVWEYIQASSEVTMAEVVDNLAGPFLMRMVHTRDGAQTCCAVIREAAAKDRKKILKAMKEHVRKLVEDEYAHVVLMAALGMVDDTALLRKSVCGPLQEMMSDVLDHKYGRRVILQLLAPFRNRYVPVDYQEWIRPNAAGDKPVKEEDDASEEKSDKRSTSLKDPDVRRKEVLGQGKGSLANTITDVAEKDADALLRSFHGADCILEIARGGADGILREACPEGVERVQEKLVALVAQPKASKGKSKSSEDGSEEHVLVHYAASRTLRRILLEGQEDEGASDLAGRIWNDALKGRCSEWFGTHADKVLAALLSCGNDSVIAAAAKEMKPLAGKGGLDAWAASHGLQKPTK